MHSPICCSLYLEIKVGCGRFRLTSSNCQTLNLHLHQMQGSWRYLLYKPRYSPFCRGKIQLAAFDGPFLKPPPQMQKISQISLTVTQAELQPILSRISLSWQRGSVRGKCDFQHSMAYPHNHFRRQAWCSGNASDPISEVTVRRARLILRWVTACGQVNHLGM